MIWVEPDYFDCDKAERLFFESYILIWIKIMTHIVWL